MGKARRNSGLTFLEVMIAASLLAVVMLAVVSAAATGQTSVRETSEQTIAMNAARNKMEELLQADWTALLGYYKNYLNRTYQPGPANPPNFFGVALPGEAPVFDPVRGAPFPYPDPVNPSVPANRCGDIVVREPLAGECPGYMGGNTHFPQAAFPGATPVPTPPNPQAPTMLVLIVTVDLNTPPPSFPWARPSIATQTSKRTGTRGAAAPPRVQLRSMRSFL
ncbi:MAG: prepilin-type N-terminal cleavage/methylation domain-containing protein [Planctomycetota bacterium]